VRGSGTATEAVTAQVDVLPPSTVTDVLAVPSTVAWLVEKKIVITNDLAEGDGLCTVPDAPQPPGEAAQETISTSLRSAGTFGTELGTDPALV
jgi:hypothetical protein